MEEDNMDNNSFNFNNEGLPRPKYINEYRKMGDMFRFKSGKEKSYLDQLLLQIFISLIILAFALLINSINVNIAKDLTIGIKKVINWNIDFQSVMEVIKGINLTEDQINEKKETPLLPISSNKAFIMPIEGEVTSEFGERVHPVFGTVKVHNGIDIAGEYGDKIKASMEGQVAEVGEDSTLGKFIKIENGEHKTLYAHCSKIIAKEGQRIKQGEVIAEVGDTGLSAGVHLHFEIWENNLPVNPLEKLNNP